MKDLEIKVSVTDVEPVCSLLRNVSDLMKQIDMAEFQDENGHFLKMNKAYISLNRQIEEFKKL